MKVASQDTPSNSSASEVFYNGGECRNFHQVKQEADSWCWAACLQMAYSSFGLRPHIVGTQCFLVTHYQNFHRKGDALIDCCNHPTSEDCVCALDIKQIEPIIDRLGMKYKSTDFSSGGFYSFEELGKVINQNHPIGYIFNNNGERSHMVMISAWAAFQGVQYVLVNDPARDNAQLVLFSEFFKKTDSRTFVWQTEFIYP